ncbi:MAG TPA: ATP-binding cassette domain-containing protein [Thermohalobaculum sp.]|nr:ATP-binding cassette domain-containing protein [Thermohalobaculum sp.]
MVDFCAATWLVFTPPLTLPEGYETRAGEGGHALSAGQRQRIALARAVFRNPFLIVLDEPNSNLDNDGEQALAAAIKALRDNGAIVVVIAHRPSAIVHANKILVLDGGIQSAFGPKEEVLPRAVKSLRQDHGQQQA